MVTINELLAMQDKGFKPRKRPTNEEHHLQCSEVRYMHDQHPELTHLFLAIPNGQKRTPRQTQWLKDEGMVPGASDIILLKSNSRHGYLCIENKTTKGRQSEEQKIFEQAVKKVGGMYIIVRSLDEFIKTIEDYLNGEI